MSIQAYSSFMDSLLWPMIVWTNSLSITVEEILEPNFALAVK